MTAGGDHDAAVLREGFDLLVGIHRESIDTGKDQHLIGNANAVDRIGIDEVQIEAGVEHLRDDGVSEELLHRLVDGDVAPALIEAAGRGGRLMLLVSRLKAGPHIVIRQQQRDIIRGLALAQREADALQIFREIGHREEPRIVRVERRGGVHAPSGSPAISGEYGQPWPMSWLMPCRKWRSASAFMSSGVARNAGECSQVQVSDEMTLLPKRCPAEEAQRVSENSRHILMVALPSPSGRSA